PSINLTKTAITTSVPVGGLATYSYTVSNTGCGTLTCVQIVDDNGTPDYCGDDFLVGTVDSLAAGASKTFTVTVYLPIKLCMPDAPKNTCSRCGHSYTYGRCYHCGQDYQSNSGCNSKGDAGYLIPQLLANGNMRFTFIQASNVNDNTYGSNSSGWGYTGHKFS